MDRLRFGTFLAPNIMPVYQAVTDEVERRLGIPAELVVETDYEACADDRNEVCFVCSLPYVRVRAPRHRAGRAGRGAGAARRALRRQADLLLRRHRPP